MGNLKLDDKPLQQPSYDIGIIRRNKILHRQYIYMHLKKEILLL